MPEQTTMLSPAGALRRDAMLETLVGELAAHHRRRRGRRSVAGAALVALVGVAAVVAGTAGPGPLPAPTPSPIARETAPVPSCVVVRMATAPGTARRYSGAVTTGAIEIERIDETTLLMTLASLGRPSGIVEMDGRTRVVGR